MKARHTVRYAVAGIVGVALVAGGVVMARVNWRAAPPSRSEAPRRVAYWTDSAHAGLVETLRRHIAALGYEPVAAARSEEADVAIGAAGAGGTPIQLRAVGQPAKLTSGALLTSTQVAAASLLTPNYHHLPAATMAALRERIVPDVREAKTNSWNLLAVGDIIIGRTVYRQMQRYGMKHPFEALADTLSRADVTLADLECTISDAKTIVTDEGMTFASPQAAAVGLQMSGIDAVNVANNHSFNVGAAGFVDTLEAMKRLGVKTFGGGLNDREAHSPLILTTHGVKIALLGYSSIVGSQAAGASTPGMAHLTMAPWGAFDEDEARRMEADIRAARTQADVVMVYYHWGTEYTHDANADQRAIAHRAIDAGADLILGTHPHWVQGVEWYKDRLITYSLGNFVFDQEWSTPTKQGTMLKASFDGSKLTTAELVPYQIEDYQQPRPVNAAVAQQILGDVYAHSWWPAN